ncbi:MULTISPECIES: holo-ACP synthase [Leuconostoc]|uniref:Holo-[acyl-carrier-protein] synthase n=2 Tax=Leuconostoc kimchii TaxID=136609 RepID=D5T2K3_LEUKI|nr:MULTISPECIES: holo-ACP synthase [Leuconostoc]ADG40502.1 Holo-[acyl-carrier protein] synthase [Leuconostoc kimchii IMSNU 11154]AEJ31574.1 4'-phosphopantetheinyl transferase [Leuconostoc sp. C2]QBR46970.1 holo-ACP synthase [Leuconostoc kimchii]
MIIGIGNDTESISRVGQIDERQINFINTILTESEREQASKRKGKHYNEFVAGRFSSKEAFSKATGYGIGEKVHWHDIEVLNADNGRPIMRVKNFAYITHVAITHSGDQVNTVVIIERLTLWDRMSLILFPKRGVLK